MWIILYLIVIVVVAVAIVGPGRQCVKLVIYFSNNKKPLKHMGNLKIGAPDLAIILGLIDTDTKEPIAGATFTNVSYSIDNPEVAVIENEDEVKGLTVGSVTLSVTADATYTDSVSGESVTKTGLTATAPIIVSLGEENVGLTVDFGAPSVAATE